MKSSFSYSITIQTSLAAEVTSECSVIELLETETNSAPEVISPTKIISCQNCFKLFSSQKKLDQHRRKYELIRAQKCIRDGYGPSLGK